MSMYISRRIFKQKRISKPSEATDNRRNEEIGFRATFIPPNVNARSSGARGRNHKLTSVVLMARPQLRAVVARIDNGKPLSIVPL